MLYKFKSRAAADLILLEPQGRQILEIIGKTPGPTGIVTAAQIPAALAALHHQSGAAVADLGEITMTFPTESGARAQRARLIDRAALRPGATLSGPALLIEYSATTVLPGGWRAEVDAHGALHLSA